MEGRPKGIGNAILEMRIKDLREENKLLKKEIKKLKKELKEAMEDFVDIELDFG